ncbi:hypothetical protein CG001_02360 [Mesoplasma coleopterae]|uniref:lipoprotein n=1 Tax=Mesoplasma coleopterae TaxID=324078 RepID=UPI000D03A11B|nr:lipoprotein [Mesoplasma coleopterae]AVN62471.1 hypothetical protein CG001_02360 [Mesoplasma coleopterae]
MKKLLSILGAVGLTATGASVAVSCGTATAKETKDLKEIFENVIFDVTLTTSDGKDTETLEVKAFMPYTMLNFFIFTNPVESKKGETTKEYANRVINKEKSSEWKKFCNDFFKKGEYTFKGTGEEANMSATLKIKNYDAKKMKNNILRSIDVILSDSTKTEFTKENGEDYIIITPAQGSEYTGEFKGITFEENIQK